MTATVFAAALLTVLTDAETAAAELVITVPAEEQKSLIERNELQYEEYKWHSKSGRIRIAKIDAGILQKSGANVTFTPFSNGPSIPLASRGLKGSRWTGERTTGRIPEQAINDATANVPQLSKTIDRVFNKVELNVESVIKDPQSGEYVALPANYERLAPGQSPGDRFGDAPVIPADADIIYRVYGSIAQDPSRAAANGAARREFSIKPLYNDPGYVLIYEWDSSKDHHLLEPPADPEAFEASPLGQEYMRLREEKAAHMQRVEERIAARKKAQKGEPQ
ncbi:MAG: hypothetical protein OEM60_01280 [Gammaproteobacteria bacterium]|nr:hypothetical protein [Gammaproteobacteria bacterium]MDH3432464.1 hypothetical protein [Gammaproteobacteria bacterium]